MFLYGDNIINDHHIGDLLTFLSSSHMLESKDYVFVDADRIALLETKNTINSKFCYRYNLESVNKNNPYVGRNIDHKQRKVTDYVFDKNLRNRLDFYPPWTLGWKYDYNCSSVSRWIMGLISKIPLKLRNNIEYLTSYITAKIDCINDPFYGLIEGRWENTFSKGKRPEEWIRSSEIFREKANNKRPVKYGQCWVLADLLTGIFRFLGLPSKTVRVNNCIMDIYRSGGVDYIESLNGICVKSNNSVNFRHLINDTTFEYIETKDISPEKNNKGCVFSLNNELETDEKDFYDTGNYLNKKNKSWNFHVWTEVMINNEWCIYDPSPLNTIHDFTPYVKDIRHHSLIGKKILGPIPVKYIKDGKIPTDYPLVENFRYLFNCINGTIRYWCPLQSPSGQKTIMYLANINYDSVKVYERDRNQKKIDVTKRYKCNYNTLHLENPLYFSINGNNITELNIFKRNYSEGNYIVQICILLGNTPLYIHREKIKDINNINFLLFLKSENVMKYREIADRFTVMIYDQDKDKVYFQGIRA